MDDKNENLGPLSGLPPTAPQGPRRRAPIYYAGEHYGRRSMQYPDVERNRDGSMPGIRDKHARRIIRAAFKRQTTRVERGLRAAREMKRQARQLADDRDVKIEDKHNGNRSTYFASTSGETHWANRLFAKELAIHQPVYAPSKKELRKMRTAARKAKRAGKLDAIGQLVDRMQKP